MLLFVLARVHLHGQDFQGRCQGIHPIHTLGREALVRPSVHAPHWKPCSVQVVPAGSSLRGTAHSPKIGVLLMCCWKGFSRVWPAVRTSPGTDDLAAWPQRRPGACTCSRVVVHRARAKEMGNDLCRGCAWGVPWPGIEVVAAAPGHAAATGRLCSRAGTHAGHAGHVPSPRMLATRWSPMHQPPPMHHHVAMEAARRPSHDHLPGENSPLP